MSMAADGLEARAPEAPGNNNQSRVQAPGARTSKPPDQAFGVRRAAKGPGWEVVRYQLSGRAVVGIEVLHPAEGFLSIAYMHLEEACERAYLIESEAVI